MKRILACLLCVLLTCAVLALPVGAVSDEEAAALKAKFRDGVTLEGADYVYYSPVNGLIDKTQYPLLVFLNGEDVGETQRSQIDKNGFCNFASETFQARFTNTGGCFLLAPRLGGTKLSSALSIKSCIEQFISLYRSNIDEKAVYLMGYSSGANMIWSLLKEYPTDFSAALPIAATILPEKETVSQLKNTAVWLFSSDSDFNVNARSEYVRTVFVELKRATNDMTSVRMTSFSNVVLPNGQYIPGKDGSLFPDTHSIWYAVTNDMHMENGASYSFQTTVDGMGEYFDFLGNSGVIEWLSRQSLQGAKSTDYPDEFLVPFRLLEIVMSILGRLLNRLFSLPTTLSNLA